mgnify:CR=1 FL=1
MQASVHGADLLTVLSLITSWLTVLYLLLFKALVWITSRGETPRRVEVRHSLALRRQGCPVCSISAVKATELPEGTFSGSA